MRNRTPATAAGACTHPDESKKLLVGKKLLSAALISAAANQGSLPPPPPAVSLASSPLQMGPGDCCTSLDDADPHPSACRCYFRTAPAWLRTSKSADAALKRAHLSAVSRRRCKEGTTTTKRRQCDGQKQSFACFKCCIVRLRCLSKTPRGPPNTKTTSSEATPTTKSATLTSVKRMKTPLNRE